MSKWAVALNGGSGSGLNDRVVVCGCRAFGRICPGLDWAEKKTIPECVFHIRDCENFSRGVIGASV
jgi:hypothetical protein